MNDVLEAIIFFDDLSLEKQNALFAEIEKDPNLSRSFKRWRGLQQKVRASIGTQLPDRNLLVLQALAQEDAALLTEDEQRALSSAKKDLDNALRVHPGLSDVIDDIKNARSDFLSVWDDLANASDVRPALSFAPDRATTKPKRRSPALTRIASVFTVLALVVTASILMWRSQNLEIVRTSPGEFKVIELTDGSTVRLFGKSKISYTKHQEAFSQNREIELKGRAFFDIAPKTAPFVVQTSTALTEATGTRFSIEADRSLTRVILTAGQVAVSSRKRRGENILLAPGQMTRVPRRSAPSNPESIVDLTDMLSWTGLLVFHDTPLDEVAAHLSAHYNVTVDIDSQLLDEQWVATYDPDTLSVDEILDNLAATLGARVETSGGNTFLLRP
ncbi:MAG: FecR domain-containing protein [Bacteroidota bacterium]